MSIEELKQAAELAKNFDDYSDLPLPNFYDRTERRAFKDGLFVAYEHSLRIANALQKRLQTIENKLEKAATEERAQRDQLVQCFHVLNRDGGTNFESVPKAIDSMYKELRHLRGLVDEFADQNASLSQQIEASQKQPAVVHQQMIDHEWQNIGKGRFLDLQRGNYQLRELYASPVVAPAQQEPIKSLEFLFRHKSSGQEVTVEITRDQIIEDMDYRIRDGLSEVVCQCESIGETNVVECNCEDYEEGFELVGQPRSEDKPS